MTSESSSTSAASLDSSDSISVTGRYLILIVAFLGWGFAGVHMSIVSIVMRVAVADLLPAGTGEGAIGQWFGWQVCAFLFGAATGGYLFGIIGDRIGRARAMAFSILCYSIFSGATYFAGTPSALLILRFLTCMGIGGMWPNGIALIAEAWPNVARPLLAGVMGTAANVGILCFATATTYRHVTGDDWRWTMVVGASPLVLGILALLFVPESPKWLALQRSDEGPEDKPAKAGLGEIFRPPLLKTTIVGILLGTVPLFGGWGVSNWGQAWASESGDRVPALKQIDEEPDSDTSQTASKPDPALKSRATIARSLTGSVTSLLGGALASLIGRKLSYGLLCACAFACTQFLFRIDDPAGKEPFFTANLGFTVWQPTEFLFWMGALGFFSGFFFGWLPLCLPELFPTRVRSTGAGVSFNWGRILTGVGVLVSAAALKAAFEGQYADVGQITGYIYAVGILVILFAPRLSGHDLDD
ncbi:MAG: MFS transporter [Planctomycetaceae bacterium]